MEKLSLGIPYPLEGVPAKRSCIILYPTIILRCCQSVTLFMQVITHVSRQNSGTRTREITYDAQLFGGKLQWKEQGTRCNI